MNDNFSDQIDFTFNVQVGEEETAAAKWNWAATVFGDPLTLSPRLQTRWAAQAGDGNEAALYSDWQTRDTELGYRLLEPRVPQLKLASHCFHQGLNRRQRDLSFLRTRLETLEKINQAEPNPALRHPKETLQTMAQDIENNTLELAYLRNYIARIASLDQVIEIIAAADAQPGQSENLFRLIGLSWKGLMKLHSLSQRFPHLRYHFDHNSNEGLHFNLPGARNIAGIDIMLAESAAKYLLHCLETIATLAKEAAPLFDQHYRKQYLSSGWTPPLMLLRAIVELFNFCNFEMPYRRATVYIDRDDPTKLWIYQVNEAQPGEWQSSNQESAGDRLKRQAHEIADLLITPPAFLNCTDQSELARYCRPAIAAGEHLNSQQYQPYWSAGLARLECDQLNNYKFHSGYELSAQLLDQLIASQPHLQRAFHSSLGGPMITLRALARLEAAAFKVEAGDISEAEKFGLLSRFWRLTAKHRPLALLGQDYAKTIYKGMAAAGEAPPERSSLLSVHLSSVFTQAALGKDGRLVDPIAALVLSDQIRLVELVNESWAFFHDYFAQIQVTDNDQLPQLLANNQVAAAREAKLANSFNSKWLTATQSIWSLIRATAPDTWDLWKQLNSKISVAQLLSGLDLEQSLNYLFQVAAGTIRLMLLVETCSPVVAERLESNAETAEQQLIVTFNRFFQLPKLLDSINYYFDTQTRYDSWLSFIISFQQHLRLIAASLENNTQAGAQLEMVRTAITQLEIQYPDILNHQPAPAISNEPIDTSATAPTTQQLIAIDEASAQTIEKLSQQLIGPVLLSQLIGLARMPGLAAELNWLAQSSTQLATALDNEHRAAIFKSPKIVRDLAKLLRNYWPSGQPEMISDNLRVELLEYLHKAEQFSGFVHRSFGASSFLSQSTRQQLMQAVFAESESIREYYLCSLMGLTIIELAPAPDIASLMAAIAPVLTERLGQQVPELSSELVVLGGFRVRAGNGKITLTSSVDLNPSFTEPTGTVSAKLLWYALKLRFESLLQILRNELPGTSCSIEL